MLANSNTFLKKCDFRAVQRNASCRSRRELSNAYLFAKFGFDTAENEPCKVCRVLESGPEARAGPPPDARAGAQSPPGSFPAQSDLGKYFRLHTKYKHK